MDNEPTDSVASSDAESWEQLKALSGATTPADVLLWAQGLANDNMRAQYILSSLSVVSVLMASGEAIGFQLPAGQQTADSLGAVRDALIQTALQAGNLARAARVRESRQEAQ